MTKQETKLMTRAEHDAALALLGVGETFRDLALDYAIRHGMPIAPDTLPRITRGVVLHRPGEARQWEIPVGTAFRDSLDEPLMCSGKGLPVKAWPFSWFPLRCIDVLGEVD